MITAFVMLFICSWGFVLKFICLFSDSMISFCVNFMFSKSSKSGVPATIFNAVLNKLMMNIYCTYESPNVS